MRVFWVTFDSSCFSAREGPNLPAVATLLKWSECGWIEAIVTDVFITEWSALGGTGRDELRRKAPSLPMDAADIVSSCLRLDAKDDPKGRISQGKVARVVFPGQRRWSEGSFSDVRHLYTHIWCDRDIFVTKDGHFLKKADAILKSLHTHVMSPDDAVAHIDEAWKKDGLLDPRHRTIQSNILAGTCEFAPGGISIGYGQSCPFEIQVAPNRIYSIRGKLYDHQGALLLDFTEAGPVIIHSEASILRGGIGMFTPSRCRIRLADKLWAHVIVSQGYDRVLELRVLANNKLLLNGDIFGPERNCGVRFAKDHTEVGRIIAPSLGGAPGSGTYVLGPLVKRHNKGM
jgi:hypothetical protein